MKFKTPCADGMRPFSKCSSPKPPGVDECCWQDMTGFPPALWVSSSGFCEVTTTSWDCPCRSGPEMASQLIRSRMRAVGKQFRTELDTVDKKLRTDNLVILTVYHLPHVSAETNAKAMMLWSSSVTRASRERARVRIESRVYIESTTSQGIFYFFLVILSRNKNTDCNYRLYSGEMSS